jgi:inner membrane transporter RhtA
LLGEHLTALQWLAIGCIVAASMGSAATAGRTRTPAAQPHAA